MRLADRYRGLLLVPPWWCDWPVIKTLYWKYVSLNRGSSSSSANCDWFRLHPIINGGIYFTPLHQAKSGLRWSVWESKLTLHGDLDIGFRAGHKAPQESQEVKAFGGWYAKLWAVELREERPFLKQCALARVLLPAGLLQVLLRLYEPNTNYLRVRIIYFCAKPEVLCWTTFVCKLPAIMGITVRREVNW